VGENAWSKIQIKKMGEAAGYGGRRTDGTIAFLISGNAVLGESAVWQDAPADVPGMVSKRLQRQFRLRLPRTEGAKFQRFKLTTLNPLANGSLMHLSLCQRAVFSGIGNSNGSMQIRP